MRLPLDFWVSMQFIFVREYLTKCVCGHAGMGWIIRSKGQM